MDWRQSKGQAIHLVRPQIRNLTMRGVIAAILLATAVSCLSNRSALAAFQQQQRQELDKQQQLSIDRPVNDNENQKSIPKTLATSFPSLDNGTQVISPSAPKASSGHAAAAPSLSNVSKQQVPTSNSGGGGGIAATNHRQQQHPTHTAQDATPAATATSTLASTTSTTTTSSSSSSSSLIPSSTTSQSAASTSPTMPTAVALTEAASTISSVRAAAPSELKEQSHQYHPQQRKATTLINKQRTKVPQAQKVQLRTANDISEPKASSTSHSDNNNNNNKYREQNGELIDRMSTSQSVSFTDPISGGRQFQHVEEEKQQLQAPNQQHKGSVSSNRWTHFGARLKPLGSSGSSSSDHYQAATSNSKAQTYQRQQQQQLNHGQPQNHYQQQQPQQYRQQQQQQQVAPAARALAASPISTNQVNGPDEEEADEDQDSEALLYKMLQQQNFLPGSGWPEASLGAGSATQSADGAVGDQTTEARAGTGTGRSPASRLTDSSSKRVIKLLKSYSHIHQVDDSDDQIRGTGTRVASRRPAASTARLGRPSSARVHQQQQHHHHHHQNNRPQTLQPNARRPPAQDAYTSSPSSNDQSSSESEGTTNRENSVEEQPAAPSGAESAAEDEFECPNNGIFADEASGCQSYHVCQSGAQVQEKFQCPQGTLFNNIILTCDFAHNVQCGKSKPSVSAFGAGNDPQPQDTINRQSPKQSTTQASSQQSRPQQQQYRQPTRELNNWTPASRQHQESGPRHLSIGQPNRYQNQQQSSVQAVTRPSSAPVESTEDADDTEAPVPLVPATLPPPRNTASAQQTRQSTHRSQYPNANQQQRPRFLQSSADETASAIPQVFVNRDEVRSTEASQQPATVGHNLLGSNDASLTVTNDQVHSYNLVINHVSPSGSAKKLAQVQLPSLPAMQPPRPSIVANSKQEAESYFGTSRQHSSPSLIFQEPAQSLTSGSNRRPTGSSTKPLTAVVQTQPQQAQQYQIAQQPQQRPRSTTEQSRALSMRPISANNNYELQRQQQPLKASYVMNELKQQLASRLNKQIAQQTSPRAATQLTSDKGRMSVSSDAFNEGMLLLLRHGFADQQQSPVSKRHATGAGYKVAASTSQAIAVDPSLVNPVAPIDAQLFPHVQRLLNNQLPALPANGVDLASGGQLQSSAATQSQATVRQAPSSQNASAPPARSTGSGEQVVSSSTIASTTTTTTTTTARAANKIEPQAVSSTSTTERTTTQQAQLPAKGRPTKRVKRLKATQLPVKKPQTAEDRVAQLVTQSSNIQESLAKKEMTTQKSKLKRQTPAGKQEQKS